MDVESEFPNGRWRCQVDDCRQEPTVRYHGQTFCAGHGLAELIRRGVLKVEQTVVEPIVEAVTGDPAVDVS